MMGGGIRPWTREEDSLLKDMAPQQPPPGYTAIADEINKFFHNSEEVRNRTSCQRRYDDNFAPGRHTAGCGR